MDTFLSEGLVFELFRAEAAAGTMTTPAIVITPDIIKHRCPHCFTAGKPYSMDAFHLQRVEEALRAGVIIEVPPGACSRADYAASAAPDSPLSSIARPDPCER